MKALFTALNFRVVNALLVLASLVGMVFALYLEHAQGLAPCPLCVFQRVGLMAMGAVALAALIHHPTKAVGRRVYGVFMLLGIGWSVAVASRHVWLQNLPPEKVPACGPGLDFWLEAFPMQQVLKLVLSGSGECATIDWTFLGLSLPTWSLLFFSGCLVLVLFQLIKPMR